ncbi:hypothetical protein EVAR_87481_1 [Eumeta japonica]|uniref:Uncharacterized protein n=1 Tax=Eumeta variegata TaxID=151549 RepID=A0A4C1W077_EUMVA|nr:hypothetical protein EVAR_87481_1 [Eumeta japonica]
MPCTFPPTLDNLTDEEDQDDDALGDYNIGPTDITGTYEIHTDLHEEPENTQGKPSPLTSKKPRLPKKAPKCVSDWKKEQPTYTHFPTSDETAMTQNIEERVGGKTLFEAETYLRVVACRGAPGAYRFHTFNMVRDIFACRVVTQSVLSWRGLLATDCARAVVGVMARHGTTDKCVSIRRVARGANI